MNRRNFIAGSAVALTAASVAQADKPTPAPLDLGATVQACLQAAYACREHCIASLSTGDKMMAQCMRTVSDMIPLCEAVAQLSASKSKHLKKAVAACIDACVDCEAECKKHAAMSDVCKRAGEACTACIAACKKV
jgi:Cys-rich four helix bundle protein (predicted Tat secretion target)